MLGLSKANQEGRIEGTTDFMLKLFYPYYQPGIRPRPPVFTWYPLFVRLSFMIFPLQELIEYDDNMYEITSAASRRSYQLSMLKDPEIEENDGKVVSLAARQVFSKEVEFRIEE
jgi:DNA-directed RNA polymerase subunit omega